MKTWITIFFIIWVIRKVMTAAKEQKLRNMQDQPPPGQSVQEPFASGRPHRHGTPGSSAQPQEGTPFATGRPHEGHAASAQSQRPGERPEPVKALSDLERLFTEAMERKMGIKQSPGQARRQTARPNVAQQRPQQQRPQRQRPEPEADSWIPAQPASHPQPRREVKSERKRVARPREREAVAPAAKAAKQRPTRAGTRKRREQPRRAAQAKPSKQIPLIGRLDKCDIRRGIILAEILGPPKGLGDIESHVI